MQTTASASERARVLHALRAVRALESIPELYRDPTASHVATMMLAHMAGDDAYCKPDLGTTLETIARACQYQLNAVRQAVIRLERCGLLIVQRQPPKPSIYRWNPDHPALAGAWISMQVKGSVPGLRSSPRASSAPSTLPDRDR